MQREPSPRPRPKRQAGTSTMSRYKTAGETCYADVVSSAMI